MINIRVSFVSLGMVLSILLVWTTMMIHVDGGSADTSCATPSQLECPTDACPSGISYVDNCLDCKGNLNTDFEGTTCFHRRLFNGKDNPSPSYLYRDIAGIIVWFLAAGVATACGVGGGGIYVPLGILLLAFAPKPSSGLSQASIFGASVGGLILNLRNKHPFTIKISGVERGQGGGEGSSETTATETVSSVPTVDDSPRDGADDTYYYTRPLIDYDMALFLAPMEMTGAVLGVLIQTILPDWLYLSLSAAILGFTAQKTYAKWWDTRQKEMASRTAEQVVPTEAESLQPATVEAKGPATATLTLESTDSYSERLLSNNGWSAVPTSDSESSATAEISLCNESQEHMRGAQSPSITSDDHHDPEIAEDESSEGDVVVEDVADLSPAFLQTIVSRDYLLQRDARQYPAEKLMTLLVLWIGLTFLTFLKGGKGVESLVGITCANPWYGVLIGIQFLWTLGFAGCFGWKLMRNTQEKIRVGYPFHPDDVLWDFRNIRFYAFYTLVAGIVAGLVGIGGGMVLGPLMLIMGIHPMVSTATTATMIVLTSSSVAILFVTSGLVPWAYALTFFSTCLTGAYIGKRHIDQYVKRTGKASVLVFLLATIIAFAMVGTLVIVLIRLAETNWCFAGFSQFCSDPAENNEVVCKNV